VIKKFGKHLYLRLRSNIHKIKSILLSYIIKNNTPPPPIFDEANALYRTTFINNEPFPKPLLLEDEVLDRPQGGKTNNSTE
jgi:hypothetical protein